MPKINGKQSLWIQLMRYIKMKTFLKSHEIDKAYVFTWRWNEAIVLNLLDGNFHSMPNYFGEVRSLIRGVGGSRCTLNTPNQETVKVTKRGTDMFPTTQDSSTSHRRSINTTVIPVYQFTWPKTKSGNYATQTLKGSSHTTNASLPPWQIETFHI